MVSNVVYLVGLIPMNQKDNPFVSFLKFSLARYKVLTVNINPLRFFFGLIFCISAFTPNIVKM
jgi:hypothetical protein